ncbi:MAG: BlaI/MecI/CopY family transcriptional regulator [Clostridia bacterium]|nr:BlaI/MecI/CopY family transcriptional regulator [Clostridia bacterium]
METPKVFESEYRFCLLLWDNEPIKSGDLAKLCADKLDWKKSTTYTVIKRLTERGVIRSENSVVTSLVSKEEVQCAESRDFIDRTFGGSLPGFIAAFTSKQQLSSEEIVEIRRMIDSYAANEAHGEA